MTGKEILQKYNDQGSDIEKFISLETMIDKALDQTRPECKKGIVVAGSTRVGKSSGFGKFLAHWR